jgi:hypothetical protein
MNKPFGIALLSLTMIGPVSAAPGTLSIKNLSSAAIEDNPVCYDSTSGQLGNCPTYSDKIEIAVNCSTLSIQDAIDVAPAAGWVQLNITGTCNENVQLLGSQTTLQGSAGAKMVGQAANKASVEVYGGANNIYIRDLSISDGAGDGLTALHGSYVSLEDSIIQNNAGGSGVKAGFGAV